MHDLCRTNPVSQNSLVKNTWQVLNNYLDWQNVGQQNGVICSIQIMLKIVPSWSKWIRSKKNWSSTKKSIYPSFDHEQIGQSTQPTLKSIMNCSIGPSLVNNPNKCSSLLQREWRRDRLTGLSWKFILALR